MKNKFLTRKQKIKKAIATTLAVATVGTAGAVVAKTYADNKPPKDEEYTVQSGDTLYDISNRYYGTGIYFDDIAEYNNIDDPNDIKAGDVIKLPSSISDEIQRDESNDIDVPVQTYTVEKGDNLVIICQKVYGVNSYELALKLANYNNIEDPNIIKVGQVLETPSYEALMEVESGLKK